jgi:hypothetical protein
VAAAAAMVEVMVGEGEGEKEAVQAAGLAVVKVVVMVAEKVAALVAVKAAVKVAVETVVVKAGTYILVHSQHSRSRSHSCCPSRHRCDCLLQRSRQVLRPDTNHYLRNLGHLPRMYWCTTLAVALVVAMAVVTVEEAMVEVTVVGASEAEKLVVERAVVRVGRRNARRSLRSLCRTRMSCRWRSFPHPGSSRCLPTRSVLGYRDN